MAQVVANYAARKLLQKELDKHKSKKPVNAEDPFFTYVKDRRGRKRKVKKQIPSYIPAHDALCLAKAKKWAYRLDMGLFDLFGLRFGWSSVIGIIPGFGDVADTILSILLVFRWCRRVEAKLPAMMWAEMCLNLFFDFAIGLIPFVGDLIDVGFRANTRNVVLLEKNLKKEYAPNDMDKTAKRRSGHQFFEPADSDEDEDEAAQLKDLLSPKEDHEETSTASKRISRWFGVGGSSNKPLPAPPEKTSGSQAQAQAQARPGQQEPKQQQKSRSPPRPGASAGAGAGGRAGAAPSTRTNPAGVRSNSPPKPPPK